MVDKVSKNRIIERIEYILGYLLSKKYDHNITIHFKKARTIDGHNGASGDIREEQVLDRET